MITGIGSAWFNAPSRQKTAFDTYLDAQNKHLQTMLGQEQLNRNWNDNAFNNFNQWQIQAPVMRNNRDRDEFNMVTDRFNNSVNQGGINILNQDPRAIDQLQLNRANNRLYNDAAVTNISELASITSLPPLLRERGRYPSYDGIKTKAQQMETAYNDAVARGDTVAADGIATAINNLTSPVRSWAEEQTSLYNQANNNLELMKIQNSDKFRQSKLQNNQFKYHDGEEVILWTGETDDNPENNYITYSDGKIYKDVNDLVNSKGGRFISQNTAILPDIDDTFKNVVKINVNRDGTRTITQKRIPSSSLYRYTNDVPPAYPLGQPATSQEQPTLAPSNSFEGLGI